MKQGKSFVRRMSTYLVIGLSLLAGSLLLLGITLRGSVGLNLFAWGLVIATLAAVAMILRLCVPFVVRKMAASSRWMSGAEKTSDSGIRFACLSKKPKPADVPMGSALAVVSDREEQEEGNYVEETDYLNPPLESMEAHFNWSTGKYDAVRGMGGMYDPPYDFMKE